MLQAEKYKANKYFIDQFNTNEERIARFIEGFNPTEREQYKSNGTERINFDPQLSGLLYYNTKFGKGPV